MDRKDVEVMTCCCKGNEDDNVKHKQRDEQEKKALMTRLSRIEGQVRGIRAMVEDDRYCVDILTQVSAIQAALNGFNKELLARHIKTCVSEDIREGNEDYEYLWMTERKIEEINEKHNKKLYPKFQQNSGYSKTEHNRKGRYT